VSVLQLADLPFAYVQILGWINVIEAHKALGIEVPVNLLMCFEGMEESGSEGLDALIEAEKDKFFKGVDAVCISDNYWYVSIEGDLVLDSRALLTRLDCYPTGSTRPTLA
jgi:acetylornithine deacetylase/succinyl-diaminopimelate desuccinylase-like protein